MICAYGSKCEPERPTFNCARGTSQLLLLLSSSLVPLCFESCKHLPQASAIRISRRCRLITCIPIAMIAETRRAQSGLGVVPGQELLNAHCPPPLPGGPRGWIRCNHWKDEQGARHPGSRFPHRPSPLVSYQHGRRPHPIPRPPANEKEAKSHAATTRPIHRTPFSTILGTNHSARV